MPPKILLAALLSALLFALSGCRGTAPGPSPFPDTELVALSPFDRPPFAFLGEEHEPRGLEVELVTEIAARMARTVRWQRHPSAELLARLELGEGHLALASIGIDPEAGERVLFSRPYFTTDLVVLVREGPDEPRGLHHLAGRPIAAAPNSHAARVLREALADSVPILIHAEHELVDRLLGRAIDGIVLDRLAAGRLVDRALPVTILTPRLAREQFALVLSPDRPRLRQEVDNHLRAMEREGVLARLIEAYGLDAVKR